MVALVAPWMLQLSAEGEPRTTHDGLAEKEMMRGGGTLTVSVRGAVSARQPVELVAVATYVLVVAGDTVTVSVCVAPDSGTFWSNIVGPPTSEMTILVAFS